MDVGLTISVMLAFVVGVVVRLNERSNEPKLYIQRRRNIIDDIIGDY